MTSLAPTVIVVLGETLSSPAIKYPSGLAGDAFGCGVNQLKSFFTVIALSCMASSALPLPWLP